MKARKLLDEKEYGYDHFTRLTSTGIEADYNTISQFAEEYHQQQVKKLNIEESNKIKKARLLASLKAYGEGFQDGANHIIQNY
jgi:glutamine cyclotransferase